MTLAGSQMRSRRTKGLLAFGVGLLLITFSIFSSVTHTERFLDPIFLGVIGVVALVVGLFLLMTDLFESWLSRGQTALVDGLQAG